MNPTLTLAIFDIGGQEMFVILTVILFLFGAKKLPEMARNLGKSVESFKRAANNVRNEVINADLLDTSNDHAKLPASTTEPTSYEEAHAMGHDGYSNPTEPHVDNQPESKTEVTLNVSATPPTGTVSQSESHDQVPPQQA